MKKAFYTSLRKLQEKPRIFNDAILISTYLIFIILSIKSNNLFLKELTVCGLIIGFIILSNQTKRKN